MPLVVEIAPQALDLHRVDLTTTANTEEESLFLDLEPYRMFMACVAVTVTGGTVGAAKLCLDIYDNDKTTLLGRVDLLTSIGTAAARSELVTFGRGLTPAKQGNGTIGASIGVLKVFRWAKLVLIVTTQADGSPAVADVRLFGGN